MRISRASDAGRWLTAGLAGVLAFLVGGSVSGFDEGMWTFDNPPVERLRERYGFELTQEWLDHVRLASVRINDGGSGSFLSPRGLVLTNHHVALGQIQKLSSQSVDYASAGFYAQTEAEELRCPDLEIDVLESMEDVTERVRPVVRPEMNEAEAANARRAEIARIEKESLDRTGLRSNVVSLYRGGEYWLYRYKQYKDVRLVMAPEASAAYFGGDSDNFTYPRYCLDFSFLRVYEDGKPARTPHFLKIRPAGPAEGDLVFVTGNPGSTDRLYTSADRDYQRDIRYPAVLRYIQTYIDLLRSYAAGGAENARRVQSDLLGYTNSQKALTGEYQGLLNHDLMARLKVGEDDLRKEIETRGLTEAVDAWGLIARAMEEAGRTFVQRLYRPFQGSTLASYAATIVRYVDEIEKPDAERLPGFHDSELDPLKYQLFSRAPIYPDMEEAILGGFLAKSREVLGDDDPFINALLSGRDPKQVAAELIRGTRLGDVDFRKSLVGGGKNAVDASKDPLIVAARKLDPLAREHEKRFRDQVESVLEKARESIARARFQILGKSVYPDATFTPRLAYGTVRGYPMNGTKAPAWTTLYGLFDRSIGFGRQGEFALPERFWQRQGRLRLDTTVDFVSTVDIIGGNSGSPVVNRDRELVGLIFDGNIESLVGRFAYDEEKARAISVHPAYILEALTKLYDADSLARELVGELR